MLWLRKAPETQLAVEGLGGGKSRKTWQEHENNFNTLYYYIRELKTQNKIHITEKKVKEDKVK